MKKPLWTTFLGMALAAALLAGACVYFTHATDTFAAQGRSAFVANPAVLAIGDSITVGYDATQRSADYLWDVSRELPTNQFTSRAIFGVTTPDMYTAMLQSGVPSGNQIVIVELGTNDSASDLTTMESDYPRLLSLALLANRGARLICTGPWKPYGYTFDTIARVIQVDCEAHGGVYIDLQRLYAISNSRGPAGIPFWGGVTDDFHPNNAGHQAIATSILFALTILATAKHTVKAGQIGVPFRRYSLATRDLDSCLT